MTVLSAAARVRLEAELVELDTVLLPAARRLIAESRGQGDMSQNPDFFVAAEDEGNLLARRARIEAALEADVRARRETTPGGVPDGSVVVLDFGDGPEEFVVGSIEEQFDGVTVVTPGSPIGAALRSASPGARLRLPSGASVLVLDVRSRS